MPVPDLNSRLRGSIRLPTRCSVDVVTGPSVARSSVLRIRAEEAFHVLRAMVLCDVGHGLDITRAVAVVISPAGKPLPDVIDGLVHERFFSPEVCSQEVHGGAFRLHIGPVQAFSEQPFA